VKEDIAAEYSSLQHWQLTTGKEFLCVLVVRIWYSLGNEKLICLKFIFNPEICTTTHRNFDVTTRLLSLLYLTTTVFVTSVRYAETLMGGQLSRCRY